MFIYNIIGYIILKKLECVSSLQIDFFYNRITGKS